MPYTYNQILEEVSDRYKDSQYKEIFIEFLKKVFPDSCAEDTNEYYDDTLKSICEDCESIKKRFDFIDICYKEYVRNLHRFANDESISCVNFEIHTTGFSSSFSVNVHFTEECSEKYNLDGVYMLSNFRLKEKETLLDFFYAIEQKDHEALDSITRM